jgi:hypothetical protein
MAFARATAVILLAGILASPKSSASDRAWAGPGHTCSTASSPTVEAASGAVDVAGQKRLLQASLETDEAEFRATQAGMRATAAPSEQTWVLFAPYVWMPAMHGTIGARGVTVPIDMNLDDVFKSLDDLNGAFMGHVEVGRGDVGLIFDGMLMQLGPEGTLPGGGRLKADIGSTILEALAMKRIVNEETEAGHVSVDLLGGVRYYQVANNVRINPTVGPTIQADLTRHWVDLLVGARGAMTIAPGLQGFVRADFGGFGIGTSSDLAWNLTAGAEYSIESHPGSSLILGYRVLDIDETQKQGAQRFVYDVMLQGPFTAFAFRF